MENKVEENTSPVPEKKKKSDGSDHVVLVQITVCVFAALLVLAVGKFSPDTYRNLKEEYDKIIAQEIKKEDVVDTVINVAQDVIPQASAQEYIPVQEEKIENKETTTAKSDAVAVMASLDKNDVITVPVHGRITSRFGNRTNPISGEYKAHSGVDIAADEGTKIAAAYDGVVLKTGEGEKEGNFVKMQHSDGSETLYCHCSKLLVEKGDTVRAGDTIAKVGSTGWATGPHLHFEIKIDGEKIDPLTVLQEKDGKV